MLNQFLRVGVQNGKKKIVTFPDKNPIENMEILYQKNNTINLMKD